MDGFRATPGLFLPKAIEGPTAVPHSARGDLIRGCLFEKPVCFKGKGIQSEQHCDSSLCYNTKQMLSSENLQGTICVLSSLEV